MHIEYNTCILVVFEVVFKPNKLHVLYILNLPFYFIQFIMNRLTTLNKFLQTVSFFFTFVFQCISCYFFILLPMLHFLRDIIILFFHLFSVLTPTQVEREKIKIIEPGTIKERAEVVAQWQITCTLMQRLQIRFLPDGRLFSILIQQCVI